MPPNEVASLAVSVIALVVALSTAVFTAARFFIDMRDRRRDQVGRQPYFVLRGMWERPDGEGWRPRVTLANEGNTTAIQVKAHSWDTTIPPDEGGTMFFAMADRLAEGEALDVTNLLIESVEQLRAHPSFWGRRWANMRVEVAYRLPHASETYMAMPLVDLESFAFGIRRFLSELDVKRSAND